MLAVLGQTGWQLKGQLRAIRDSQAPAGRGGLWHGESIMPIDNCKMFTALQHLPLSVP